MYTVTAWLVTTLLCRVDSKILGKPLPHSFQLLIVLLGPFALPIYLISTRQGRGIKIILLHSFILLVILTVLAILTDKTLISQF